MHLPSDPGSLPMPPGQGPLVGSSRGGYNSLGDLQLPSGLPSLAGLNSSVLFPFRDSAMVGTPSFITCISLQPGGSLVSG